MIDLTRKSLPNTVQVGGRDFAINTDYRPWMRFEIALAASDGRTPIPVAYLFRDDPPAYVGIRDLLAFSRPPRELPRPARGINRDEIVLDFRADSDLIYAAFLQQYGIDLIDIPELHWHRFLALLHGLKGTKLDEVMGYRCYTKQTDKSIDPYEEMREAWRIEKPLTAEEQEEIENFNKQFGGG